MKVGGGRPACTALSILLAGVVAWGCGRERDVPRPTVVLIVLDTLRADRLGAYGAARPTPFLDRLAGESVVYERAYAPSSWTVPSVASLFLAQPPSEHRIAVVNAVLPEDVTTLAEALHAAGYETGGFSANVEITAEAGFGQGFDTFRTVFRPPKDDAARVTHAALEWLDDVRGRQAPVFLYLQYMEPHSPYRFHEGETAADPSPVPAGDAALAERVNRGAFALREGGDLPDAWRFTPAERARLAALYDGEVRHLDTALATLFAELEQRGLLARALVVVTADHGEQLGEHDMYSHGNTLFEDTIRVPLLVRLPRGVPPRRVREPVGVAGLAPAILRELHLAIPPTFSVPALPFDDGAGERFALAEVLKENPTYLRLHRRALVGTSAKLLVANDGSESFIDLAADPGEDHPLAGAPFASSLRQAMAAATQAPASATPRPGMALDAATRERLRALGYAD